MPPFVYRITKYDPADRDEHGSYIGAEDSTSDHGPVEAAYLQAIATFAEDTGIDRLAIREPGISGLTHFGLEPAIDGHGLAGLFPPDLSGFHDGAEVPVSLGLELVRGMLRDSGAWCRLAVEDKFDVQVGWDQYVYVSSDKPCERAFARTRALGLFPERLEASPYDADFDEPGVQRPADEDYWARLRWSIAMRHAAILEEGYLHNASRWHRLTDGNLDAVRARLTPRAQLTVWPDLSTDVDAVLASLPDEGPAEFVWEDENGAISSTVADESEYRELAAQVAGARAATALSLTLDERHPLFTAVLPDSDGVLRARWRTEPTPSDRNWAFLKTLHRGQICTGTVTEIASFGVTFVDIGGFTAMINIPELSWRRFNHPSDVVSIGQRISAEILDVDLVRERVPLSLKALQEDPMPQFIQQVGQTTNGVVTKLVPFGAFVRIEDREDGLEGFVHLTELAEGHVDRPEDVVQVGDSLTVKILDVDLPRRRITLSYLQALPPGELTSAVIASGE
ncbi:S1 RNA-binding domain-containing protein [Streptomyces sp. NBC_01294]|uniref:S1 RNA-binding domain-containing protein n=1 Tax=Streptomyces sp. NBC_01294 TaxID=2903815 RepID=UPI002DDC3F71|nr:S1 RNA-binding domain-containing protein [Streptomyces sp. NBC_01294]WRZ56340.1 S1 RNA-binding domain-containing protein [Streptomyces sp. NBC_01294]